MLQTGPKACLLFAFNGGKFSCSRFPPSNVLIHAQVYLPTISTTRNVSIIGSITSSGIRVSLLFWIFSVSREFKFSNADAGSTEMLGKKQTETKENQENHMKTLSAPICIRISYLLMLFSSKRRLNVFDLLSLRMTFDMGDVGNNYIAVQLKLRSESFLERISESQTNFRLTSLNPNVFCATMSKNKIKKFQECAEFGFE